MMLSKEVFVEGVEYLLNFYPTWNIKSEDKKVIKAWYELFKHIDEKRFKEMIVSYLNTEERHPTPGGLKKHLRAAYITPAELAEERRKRLAEYVISKGD